MKYIALMALFVILSLPPAMAQQTKQEPAPELSALCREIRPYKDGSAAYQPGVDIHGRAVPPADLDASGANVEASHADNIGDGRVYIPVQVDLLERFGVQAPAGAELKPEVALLSVGRDGSVEYNGQNLTAQAKTICDVGNEQTAPAVPASAQDKEQAVHDQAR